MRQSANYVISAPDEVVDIAPVAAERSQESFPGKHESATGRKTASESQAIAKTAPIDREELQRQAQDPETDLAVGEETMLLDRDEAAIELFKHRLRAQAGIDPEKTIRVNMDELLSHLSKARKAAQQVNIVEVKNARWPIIAIAGGLAVVGVYLLLRMT